MKKNIEKLLTNLGTINWDDPENLELARKVLIQSLLNMQSTVTWHKYPDEKPELDEPILLWDGEDVFEGWYEYYGGDKSPEYEYRFDSTRGDKAARRNNIGQALAIKIKAWSYMPEGPAQ